MEASRQDVFLYVALHALLDALQHFGTENEERCVDHVAAHQVFWMWFQQETAHLSLFVDVHYIGVIRVVIGVYEECCIGLFEAVVVEHGMHVDVHDGVAVKDEEILI